MARIMSHAGAKSLLMGKQSCVCTTLIALLSAYTTTTDVAGRGRDDTETLPWIWRFTSVKGMQVFPKKITIQNVPLQWRHNELNGASDHRRLYRLFNCWFRRRSIKTSKVTGEFPAQRGSNTENVSIWWRHHEKNKNKNKNKTPTKQKNQDKRNKLIFCWCSPEKSHVSSN